jgi:hypothetical protein
VAIAAAASCGHRFCAVASCLLLVTVLLPLALWRVWLREQNLQQEDGDSSSFRGWARGEFSVHESRLKGSDPALDAILPLASVACGLIALGTVFSLIAATS